MGRNRKRLTYTIDLQQAITHIIDVRYNAPGTPIIMRLAVIAPSMTIAEQMVRGLYPEADNIKTINTINKHLIYSGYGPLN